MMDRGTIGSKANGKKTGSGTAGFVRWKYTSRQKAAWHELSTLLYLTGSYSEAEMRAADEDWVTAKWRQSAAFQAETKAREQERQRRAEKRQAKTRQTEPRHQQFLDLQKAP